MRITKWNNVKTCVLLSKNVFGWKRTSNAFFSKKNVKSFVWAFKNRKYTIFLKLTHVMSWVSQSYCSDYSLWNISPICIRERCQQSLACLIIMSFSYVWMHVEDVGDKREIAVPWKHPSEYHCHPLCTHTNAGYTYLQNFWRILRCDLSQQQDWEDWWRHSSGTSADGMQQRSYWGARSTHTAEPAASVVFSRPLRSLKYKTPAYF